MLCLQEALPNMSSVNFLYANLDDSFQKRKAFERNHIIFLFGFIISLAYTSELKLHNMIWNLLYFITFLPFTI